MNTPQEHYGEHEQREGMGGQVRRFLDTELSRVLDKEDQGAGTHIDHRGDPDPVDRGDAGGPGYADPPASSAPLDAGREPGLQPPGPVESRGRAGDQLAAQGSGARVGLLNDVAGLREEWQRVQGTFVDDPQRAVREASVLVDRILDEIRVNVGSTHPSGTTSTEELRVSFQRYREFFERLLSA